MNAEVVHSHVSTIDGKFINLVKINFSDGQVGFGTAVFNDAETKCTDFQYQIVRAKLLSLQQPQVPSTIPVCLSLTDSVCRIS